ncbi:methylated-DNA--[protein]-cysteine S-methyltransferase [Lutispora thermophila]|uniref:Methylated-DNA--protein-cysteine methyltransferase n=1 Tax=Lutispora thermophila DSM 19022 TaxID=1122184 RepID=A0A1M6CLV9_9FIRM|nr:methylated-DNA--[protein]-cysteine S-methyltransferase [Lutispora thermophila]SHI61698.1 methylated-DNA-[protein]-cysteine S-methyltransferase [Lutispora thermophila DSM 19022]
MSIFFYDFDIGKIGIGEKDGRITNLYFTAEGIPQNIKMHESPILKETYRQLNLYFQGRLKKFTVPLNPEGTVFMKQVWASICEIPYGTTISYKDLAINLGKPNAARAVGHANSRNPIPILIPCHRVVGVNGRLTGYSGGIELKKKLLELEMAKGYGNF